MTSSTRSHADLAANNLEVPVLIVGGGGAGLTASMLLSQLGVEHAAGQRTADHVDPAEGARAQPADDGNPRRRRRRRRDLREEHARREHARRWAGTAGSPVPTRIAAGGSAGSSAGATATPTSTGWRPARCRTANLPQIRLEPILKARAEAMAPGTVRFHHELVDARAGRRRCHVACPQPRRRFRVHRSRDSICSAATVAARSRSWLASSTRAWAWSRRPPPCTSARTSRSSHTTRTC